MDPLQLSPDPAIYYKMTKRNENLSKYDGYMRIYIYNTCTKHSTETVNQRISVGIIENKKEVKRVTYAGISVQARFTNLKINNEI